MIEKSVRIKMFLVMVTALWCGAGCPTGVIADPEEEDLQSSADASMSSPDLGEPARDMSPPVSQDMAPPTPDQGLPPTPDQGERDMGAPAEEMGTPPDMAPPAQSGPARYEAAAILSPINAHVVARLEAIRAAAPDAQDEVFIKIGDSNTVNTNMARCFSLGSGARVDLDGRTHLQETLSFFQRSQVQQEDVFARESLAASVGKTAKWAISGTPSPVEQEVEAAGLPRFALVSYGTNDMQQAASHEAALWPFYESFSALLDELLSYGIIPIVTGLPPRGDTAEAALWARHFDDLTRGMAQARQIPYISLYLATEGLPAHGLIGDGLHGNAYNDGTRAQACVFTDAGLMYGFNTRNLLTLEQLDRVRRVLLAGQNPPDPGAPIVRGDGSRQAPIRITSLPFTHSADTRQAVSDAFDAYPSCDTGQDESGPEVFYQLELSEPAELSIRIFDTDADIDLHVLSGSDDASACVARHDKNLTISLAAGTHTLVADTFVSRSSGEKSGVYMIMVNRR